MWEPEDGGLDVVGGPCIVWALVFIGVPVAFMAGWLLCNGVQIVLTGG
jgi:hypothetical protein